MEVIIFTENNRGSHGVLTCFEARDFNSEYPTLKIKPNPDRHDRFIIIDYKPQASLSSIVEHRAKMLVIKYAQ